MVSRRKDKKMRKGLINKKALQYIIAHSNICKHGDYELRLAGYKPGQKNNPSSWMYEQVMEALAVFSSHGNSGMSAPWEINFVKKLCSFDIIAPLTLKDDEFIFTYKDDKGKNNYQNRRKSSIFKKVDKTGHVVITNIDAYTKRVAYRKRWEDDAFEKTEYPTCWSGGIWVVDANMNFIGTFLTYCQIKPEVVAKHNYLPKDTIILNCYEIGSDDGRFGYINFVRNDSSEFIKLCEEYQVHFDKAESIVGKNVFTLTPLDIRIAEKELKNK